MSSTRRLRSAERRIGELSSEAYSIFKYGEDTKDIAVWQPNGAVEDVVNLPTPAGEMKLKAKEFLERSVESRCHLAAAPEWAYDISWVNEHSDYLFAEDSPLFVLGCAPIRDSTREDVVDTLDTETDYDVCENDDIECDSDEFLTPTIMPIKATARQNSDDGAILIQYKNHPMSDGVNPNEQANLVEGDFIWKIDPRDAPNVIVWTCSDIMDGTLRQCVERKALRTDTIVVHVQCNPKPFYQTWIDFRNQIFDGADNKVTYVCANWGELTFDGDAKQLGYSGVYTKARCRSPLDRYDTTYENGGLIGTKPGYRCDYVWLMGTDVISRVQFKRPDPGTTGAGAASFSLPRIYETWAWDSSASSYLEATPGVPECGDQECYEWRSNLPESPLARELMSTIALGKIDFESLPEEGLSPEEDFTWAGLETLTDKDGVERLGHVLSSHPQRSGREPNEEVEDLLCSLEKAGDLGIRMNDEFALEDVPMNATYEDRPIKVCLTVQQGLGATSEQKGAKRLTEWVIRRDNKRFKPIAVIQDAQDGLVLKTLKDHEDISRIDHDPEDVSTTGELVRVDR